MNIQSLQYFVSAAKHLSFTQAADEFMIAQSAMSKQIAGIEDELGMKLFSRHNRKVTLTPAGKIFYSEAQEILQRYNNAVFMARDANFGSSEKLSIGFGMLDTQIVAAHVKAFALSYPEVSVTLNQYNYDALIQKLNDGVCDIVFCPKYRVEQLKSTKAISVQIDKSLVAVSRTNRLSEKTAVTSEDLEQQAFIVLSTEGSIHSEIFRMFYMREGFTPRKITYANTYDAVLAMVCAGYGLAMVPQFLKGTLKDDVVFLPLKANTNRKRIHVVVSLLSNDSREVENFLKISDEHFRV